MGIAGYIPYTLACIHVPKQKIYISPFINKLVSETSLQKGDKQEKVHEKLKKNLEFHWFFFLK